jgi:hypothetical protein
MLRLGKQIKKIKQEELSQNCVVSSHMGMQNCVASRANVLPKMVRDPDVAMWCGREVAVVKFPNPKNNFKNEYASAVMGRPIYGNCILVSSSGISAEEIKEWMQHSQIEPASWAEMAHHLPKKVELDEEVKERRRAEQLEREREWEIYKLEKRLARMLQNVEIVFDEEDYDKDF